MKTQTLNFLSLEYARTAKLSEKYFYKFNRYNTNFSTVLLYSNTVIDEALIKMHIRQSDKLVKLQDNFFYIVFDMTSQEKGLKAVENLLSLHESKYFSHKLYISFVNTEDYTDVETMKSHLFSLLNYAIKENNYNQITDGFYELEHI